MKNPLCKYSPFLFWNHCHQLFLSLFLISSLTLCQISGSKAVRWTKGFIMDFYHIIVIAYLSLFGITSIISSFLYYRFHFWLFVRAQLLRQLDKLEVLSWTFFIISLIMFTFSFLKSFPLVIFPFFITVLVFDSLSDFSF